MLVKEALDIPADHPPAAEVFSVGIKPLLTDYNAAVDKVTIEGILEIIVIYKAMEESRPLYSFVREVPFRHYIELEGSDEGVGVDIDLFVEEIDHGIANGQQVEIKANIGAACEISRTKSIDIISDIEEAEEKNDLKARPSLTIYYMQPEDTLWEIAKTYRTSVEKIIETNQIEDVEEIKIGDHIIIEKIHNFKF